MWIISEDGFFNIVQDDRNKNLLTIKGRRKEDLLTACHNMGVDQSKIEESDSADYRFRVKAPIDSVSRYISRLVKDINYPKTKPMLEIETPGRDGIYLAVWDTLSELQDE